MYAVHCTVYNEQGKNVCMNMYEVQLTVYSDVVRCVRCTVDIVHCILGGVRFEVCCRMDGIL